MLKGVYILKGIYMPVFARTGRPVTGSMTMGLSGVVPSVTVITSIGSITTGATGRKGSMN